MPYYYNASLKKSTYSRPLPASPKLPDIAPSQSSAPIAIPPALLAQPQQPPQQFQQPKVQKAKKEKPSKKTPVEGTEWLKITTNYGNVFYTHKERKESVWEIPPEIKTQVDELEAKEKAIAFEIQQEQMKVENEKKRKIQSSNSDWVDVDNDNNNDNKRRREDEDEKKYAEAAAAAFEEEQAKENARKEEEKKREDELKRAEEEAVRKAEIEAAASGIEYDFEEGKALFKSMLEDYDINPLIPWDLALPIFIKDERYRALKNTEDRQMAFDEYCRDKPKKANKKIDVDPKVTYQELLRSEVTSTRTRFEDFRKTFKKDRRFFSFGRDDKEREKIFKSWLRELGECE